MSSAAVTAVVRSYFDALASRDLDAIVEHWQPRGLDHLAGEDLVAPEGVRDYFAALFAAFPDLHQRVLELYSAEDRCAVRWCAEGTFRGPGRFRGFLPTGAAVTFEGADFMAITEGRIHENHAYVDGLDVGRKLGLMPPPGSSTDRLLTTLVNVQTKARIARAVKFFEGNVPLPRERRAG